MEELLKSSEAPEEKKPWEAFGYREVNQIIKGQFMRAQDAVVTIGYYLRRVYNEQLYHDGGYGSFEDYAREEYGISRSTASRYMDINREFSIDGNSPRIDDRYRNFNKSQLQEMLYLTEEQREQVDVGMTVKGIRQLRHEEETEEAPYAQEQEIQEPSFQLEFETDDEAGDVPAEVPETIDFETEIEDSLENEPAEESETLQNSLDRKGGCPPEVPGCRRQEWGTSPQAQAAGKKECNSCWAEWERRNKILNEGRAEACAMSQQTDPEQSMDMSNIVDSEEVQAEQDNLNAEWMVMDSENASDVLAELERTEQMTVEKPKQPELPLLKNNEQRAAFVDAYETWPLWIETEQTGERYYRYDLEDGSSMVVKVYHAMLFDYKVTGVKYEDRYTEGYGKQEYYLLRPGNFFKDCEVNRSTLIEKLKELQKKGN